VTETSENPSTPKADAVRRALGDAAVGRWVLDPGASSVAFASKTFWGLATVRGTFSELSGEGEIGADGTAHGIVKIGSASLNTKNAKRDTHLRSADFFDAEKHPYVEIEVKHAELQGNNDVSVEAELTAAGITRPLRLAAKLTEVAPDAVTLRAETKVDRKLFGMTWNQMGMLQGPSTATVVARFTRVRDAA
jgi:polyisoprenoid-binding protein YceI